MQPWLDKIQSHVNTNLSALQSYMNRLLEQIHVQTDMSSAVMLVVLTLFLLLLAVWLISRRKRRHRSRQTVGVDGPAKEIEDTKIFPATDDAGEPLTTSKSGSRPVIEKQAAEDGPVPFFQRLKNGLSKTRKTFTERIEGIISPGGRIDRNTLEEIEELLITSDIGVQTSADLIETLSKKKEDIRDAAELKETLKQEILAILTRPVSESVDHPFKPLVIMVVGVNGVGKTTSIGKLAARFTAQGKKVLIAAADTFRAAAVEQLAVWAERAGADMVRHKEGADPAAVAYDGVEAAMARNVDVLLIDTAGRLHTKVNLMEELKKIKRSVGKRLPGAPHETLMILDATTGQNALSQAKLFHDAIGITGFALTKLDGTAKGGIVVGIRASMNIPLKFIGVGESIEDMQDFDPGEFVDALFG